MIGGENEEFDEGTVKDAAAPLGDVEKVIKRYEKEPLAIDENLPEMGIQPPLLRQASHTIRPNSNSAA